MFAAPSPAGDGHWVEDSLACPVLLPAPPNTVPRSWGRVPRLAGDEALVGVAGTFVRWAGWWVVREGSHSKGTPFTTPTVAWSA